ncbi:MAG TPA: glutathione S-transferase family protein [Gaiellales bacterium]|jgi:glutathione S-transferase|nr:glutathione S-transferase family protein [Gaiellales bacterium]
MYVRRNPARETPALETEDGRLLPDSSAILLYLADATPFLPGDAFGRAHVVRWLVYEQSVVIPAIAGLRFRLQTARLAEDEEEALRRRRAGTAALALLDDHLAGNDFFADRQYSVADIAMYGCVHVAKEAGLDLAAYDNVREWLERVRSRPLHMNDLEPYPPNARRGAGRSVYD